MKQSRVTKPPHSDKQENVRPLKRQRINDPTEEISILNETGISNLQSGRDDEAERCFSQALGRADGKFSFLRESSSSAMPSSETLNSDSSALVCCPRLTVDSFTDASDNKVTPPNTSVKSTLLYIYQRQEYDEGMYMFSNALPLDEILSGSICSATLLYNVGQTHVRRRSYVDARKWLELSLLRVTLETEFDTATATMTAMIYHNLGHCLYRLGCNDEAMQNYQKAIAFAKVHKLGALLEAAANNAVAVLLFHKSPSEADNSLKLLQESLVVYRSHFGSDSREVATLLNNIGRVHYLKEEYSQALEAYEEALAIRRKVLGKDSIDVAATICNTGQAYHQRGDFHRAMDFYTDFLELAEKRLGSNHRDIAVIFKCMAEIHQERGEMEQARKLFEKALESGRTALGNIHPELALTLNKLGNLFYETHDLEKALYYYSEGLRVERAVLKSTHPHIIVTLMNIAQIYRLRGSFAAALINYGEIHALQLKINGINSLIVASTLSSMGLMQYQLHTYSEAFNCYQEALRIQRDHYGSDENADVASTLNSIGLVLFNQGIYSLAMSCFTDSLHIRRRLLGPDHRDVAILWYNIATICLETGEDEFAIKLYKETLRVERKALGESHHDVILTLQHLALVYQRRGELDEALLCFSEALEIERTKVGTSRIAVGKLLNLIGNIHLQRANVGEMMSCYTEASRIYRSWAQQNDTLVIAGYNFYGLSKLHPPCAPIA
jgi:tetratricopeptide (TPR) repeat protein